MDYMLVVTGGSPPHIKALYDEVQKSLKQKGVQAFRRSGTPDSGWMVIDYVDVVIHIFLPETRDYYAIETLWEGEPENQD